MTSPYDTGTASQFPTSSGNSLIDPFLVWGWRWGTGGLGAPAVVTYSFPQSGAEWIGSYNDGEPFNGFQPFNASQQDAARHALALWAEVANVSFVEVAETPSAGGVDGNVGDIRFGFSAVVTNDPNAIAWSYFPYSDANFEFPEAGDIWLDPAFQPNLQMSPGEFGFYTLLHEIGHALGLDHPFADTPGEVALPWWMDNNQYSVMSYDVHPYAWVEAGTPMPLDILAIQYLYGANMNTGAGNDSYVFSTKSEVLKTIWDAGGVDTFDCSNQTYGVYIDLNDGAFSSIGPHTAGGRAEKNIAIAYGAMIENAVGGSGDDFITGNELANTISGNVGNDFLQGDAGNDVLEGGAGKDVLAGGSGNDIYILFTAGDTIDEFGNADTADQIFAAISVNLVTMGDGAIENAALISNANLSMTGNASANVLIGGEGNNTINGAGGDDVLAGQGGNDTLTDTLGNNIIYGGTGNDVITAGNGNDILLGEAGIDTLNGGGGNDQLYGGDGADKLNGGAGNDLLLGGLGADVMAGGTGSDIYFVDDIKDTVTETGTDLNDEIRTVFSVNLTTQFGGLIEHAIIEGTALSITGNARDNRMTGNALSNTLIGLGGNDVLDGGGGDDILKGGAGADAYVIDSLGDVIDEEGNKDLGDIVIGAFSFDLATFAGGVIENAILLGTADLSATGTAIANGLVGNAGANVLDGGGGDDTIIGGDGNDTLLGGQGNDSLDGGTGDDVLKGGSGIDKLMGGAGNDVYVLGDPGSVMTEGGSKDTDDEVQAAFSIDLETLDGGSIEHVTLLGSDAVNASGNSRDNRITGNAGANVLTGGNGDDTLDGGAGADMLRGGAGNDIYIVDNVGDVIDEQGNKDFGDVVRSSSISIDLQVLGAGAIEQAALLGSKDLDLLGSANGNRLEGNDSANVIDGRGSNDILIGGGGNDTLIGGADFDKLFGGDGDDRLHVTDLNTDFLDGGDGIDTIVVDGAGLDLTFGLTALLNSKSIERLDLSGTGANQLHLAGGDIFALGGILRIDGDADDTVSLQYGFDYVEDLLIDGSSYKRYVAGGTEALIDSAVTVVQEPLSVLRYNAIEGALGFTIANTGPARLIGIGDINADGSEDYLVTNGTKVNLITGDADRSYDGVDLAALGADGTTYQLSGGTNFLGWSLGPAGDFNGDGVADIVMGAPALDDKGRAFVLFGNEDGSLPIVDLANMTSADGFYVSGSKTNEWAGSIAHPIGDMNGDGYDDVIIGASFKGSSSSPATAYIAYGQGAISTVANTLAGAEDVEIDPVPRPPSVYFAQSSSSGDFNGDGYADVIVGGPTESVIFYGNGIPGQTLLKFGTSIGQSSGDFNGDGYDDIVIVGSTSAIIFGGATLDTATLDVNSFDGANGVILTGMTAGVPISLGGDINGDGFDDLIVGDPNAMVNGNNAAGRVSVIFGHAGTFDAKIDVTDHAANPGFSIVGELPFQAIGGNVQVLGDLDGDGFDDLAISNNWTASERVAILYGQAFDNGATVGTAGKDSLSGDTGANALVAGQGDDVINGNGGADAINGGQGNDEIHVADNKFFRIDGGTGTDTLHLDYSGAIDFGNLDGNAATSDRGRIESVEVIDLANGHANALTLHLADVLDLDVTVSNVGGVAALDNALRIDGEAGDTLQLFSADGWGAADTGSLAGYAIYTYQAVKIAVDTDIVVSVT